MLRFRFLFFIIFFIPFLVLSQDYAYITGVVKSTEGELLFGVNVTIEGSKKGTSTKSNGQYLFKVPSNKLLTINYTYQSKTVTKYVGPLLSGQTLEFNVEIDPTITFKETNVSGKRIYKDIMVRIKPEDFDLFPQMTEASIGIVKSSLGVTSSNEFSSSYSVRGGNFDENLVYINDIEIYRPFLTRAGQQEGLPIINSDLVESINFSAGGFEAKYGDKLSSVLDIEYRKPTEFKAGFSVNALGANVFAEGRGEGVPYFFQVGARIRSSSYLLNSLDVEGEYNTLFTDIQSNFSYDLNENWSIGLFSYYGQNKYNLIPETQTTDYGTSDLVLRFKVYFDGQEITKYENILNSVSLNFTNDDSFSLKWIASVYNTFETEYYDIMGQYWLDQVDKDPGSESFDSAKVNFGVGTFLNHARNSLYANIYSFQFKGEKLFPSSTLSWGLNVQNEIINDQIREWKLIDSADYIIPISNGEKLELQEFLTTNITLNSLRYSCYAQQRFNLDDSSQSFLTAGVRANYWDYNNELIITPRFQFTYEPNRKKILRAINSDDQTEYKNLQLKAATGLYYQPAFYRELRDKSGVLNPEIRAQKSYQILLGSDLYFKKWDRNFKWTTEIYFKYLWDIIPYDVEDVRVRYHANNDAVGFATGIDMQIYGEFIEDLPSWINVGVMKTMENLDHDYTYLYDKDNIRVVDPETGEPIIIEQGYIPRPTDQTFRAAIYFQDLLKKYPNNKVSLNFVFATPVPFGPPQFEYLRNELRMRAYKRVDVGFSRLLISKKDTIGLNLPFANKIESAWLTAEIFNAFGNRNVISYFWVKDVNNNYWGVPNFLTNRRFNLNLTINF